MPCDGVHPLFEHGETRIGYSICDGCDSPRDRNTRLADHVMVTLQGRFSVRHRRGRVVFDPSRAAMYRSSDDYSTFHPDGGDRGLIITSPAINARLEPWQCVAISAEGQVRLHDLTARLQSGEADVLGVEETLAMVFDFDRTPPRASARARAKAEEIAHEVATHFDQPLPLATLSQQVGLSPFAATRLFRGATGFTIHQYQVELRLRHALALLMQTDQPLAQIAVATGFANQGHFGNHFRRRYGVPPGRARSAEGLKLLVADGRTLNAVDSRKDV
jgi:AraC-like DNA-binding protein